MSDHVHSPKQVVLQLASSLSQASVKLGRSQGQGEVGKRGEEAKVCMETGTGIGQCRTVCGASMCDMLPVHAMPAALGRRRSRPCLSDGI